MQRSLTFIKNQANKLTDKIIHLQQECTSWSYQILTKLARIRLSDYTMKENKKYFII